MKLLFLLYPFFVFSQVSGIITNPDNIWSASDTFVSIGEPDYCIEKYEVANDTLYVYVKETHVTYAGCLVMNCTSSHRKTIKYRIPFYVEEGNLKEGEAQHQKYRIIKKEVEETIEDGYE